jgi:thiol-disulfide isomerase/thioredoxin
MTNLLISRGRPCCFRPGGRELTRIVAAGRQTASKGDHIVAATTSTMLKLGTKAPDFALPEPAKGNTIVSLDDFAGSRAYLVMFICNHCPYVTHVADELAKLAMAYQAKGVAVIGICANNVETHPDDSPQKMIEEVSARRIPRSCPGLPRGVHAGFLRLRRG